MPIPELDCQGLSCPQPVLECKTLIDSDQPRQFSVLVDNEASLTNVKRFLGTQGYDVEEASQGKAWRLTATRGKAEAAPENAPAPSVAPNKGEAQRITVLLTTANIGRGDDELGGKLMANFLTTLPELGSELWRLVLLNGAVKLAVTGSPVTETLQALENSGVTILVCGTCLDFFDLLQDKAVGQTTNMLDVVTSLQLADKVIRP